MIKDILNSNEEILPNTKQIEVLKENFPACFNADGSFDIERFKEYLSDKLMVSNEGYELKFLGKNYARLLASIDTLETSIAIPTITGGMYSPDFMYVVKHKNGHKELNIIVETKDVENKTDLRGTEKAKIECAKVFFNMLTADGYTVHFRDQLGNKQMAQIISEVMRGEN